MQARVPPLSERERDIHRFGLVSVLKEIHDEIDREVFAAYGWQDLGTQLVGKPGATTPTLHKTDGQEVAEEEMLTRLLELNHTRSAQERSGVIQWLRPTYQRPRLARRVSGQQQFETEFAEAGPDLEHAWPTDGLAQIRIVRDLLQEAESPLVANEIASLFKGRSTQKRRDRVAEVLETLAATGAARVSEEAYFLPR